MSSSSIPWFLLLQTSMWGPHFPLWSLLVGLSNNTLCHQNWANWTLTRRTTQLSSNHLRSSFRTFFCERQSSLFLSFSEFRLLFLDSTGVSHRFKAPWDGLATDVDSVGGLEGLCNGCGGARFFFFDHSADWTTISVGELRWTASSRSVFEGMSHFDCTIDLLDASDWQASGSSYFSIWNAALLQCNHLGSFLLPCHVHFRNSRVS